MTNVMTDSSSKVGPSHLNRRAYVYVRQSSPQQVLHHAESRRRQYQMVDWVQQVGWPKECVVVIDEDQGKSGAQASVARLSWGSGGPTSKIAGSRSGGADAPPAAPADPEVPARPRRRTYTAEYKLKILEQADACKETGQLGALLRREGLYHSNLITWRRQCEEGALKALRPKKRGRKAQPPNPWPRVDCFDCSRNFSAFCSIAPPFGELRCNIVARMAGRGRARCYTTVATSKMP